MRKIIIITIACIVIFLIFSSVFSYRKTMENEYIENLIEKISIMLEAEEYSGVFDIYQSEEIKFQERIVKEVEIHIKQICEEALNALDLTKIMKLKSSGWNYLIVDDTIKQIETELETILISNENYVNAVDHYKNREFEKAREGFESVINVDENYDYARDYITEIDIRDKSWNDNITGRNYFYNSTCFDGEYIYVPFILNNIDGIHKISSNGNDATFFPLSDEAGGLVISSINVVGEYLYFIAGENVGSGYTFDNPYNIYEMKKDGTDISIVAEGNFIDLFIKEDKIYAISRENGLVEYDRNFIVNKVICENNVVEFSFNEEGIYYTVQEDLTYKNKNSVFFYNGSESKLVDSNEYLHYYQFGDTYIKHWQHNSTFELLNYGDENMEVGIRNADIYKFYGMINGEIFYSCNGSLGREVLYTYQIDTNITKQLCESMDETDYKIIAIFYEENKFIIEQTNKLFISDLKLENMDEIAEQHISENELIENLKVIQHLTDSEIYINSNEEQIISIIYDKQNWHYKDEKLNITIEKRYVDEYDCNVYVTHIFTKDYSLFRTGNANIESLTASKTYKGSYISDLYQAIYSQNTDTFIGSGNKNQGIIIRQGELIRDIFVEDMIAYFDDGTMEIYRAGDEVNAQRLLDKGATTSFSFGPILVDDYKVDTACVAVRLSDRNPRSAIGYIESGHYVMVASDGRDYKVSRGLTMIQLARIFEDEGCKIAYNLDGGMTTSILFMGNYVTHRPSYSSGSEWFFYRSVAELFYIGTNESSPIDIDQLTCDYDYFTSNLR